jgi:hypothetical protein
MTVQPPLQDFAFEGDVGAVLKALRREGKELWFPHPEQMVVVQFAPDGATHTQWQKVMSRNGRVTRQPLHTGQVCDRIRSDDAVYECELRESAPEGFADA